MKLIPLPNGQFTKVDDADFEWLSRWKWRVNHGYVVRGERPRGQKFREVFMHLEIKPAPAGFETDHHNRDKLDNQRENLRFATPSQNQWNRGVRRDSRSGIKNVRWDERKRRWSVTVRAHRRVVYAKRFRALPDAIAARDAAHEKICADFAPQAPDRARIGPEPRGFFGS